MKPMQQDERKRSIRVDAAPERPGPVGTVLGQSPGEIYVRRRRAAGGPAYIRLRKGDCLVEGDGAVPRAALEQWTVTAITPDLVAAVDRRGRSVSWPRERIERALATGELSTPIRGFEHVVAHRGPGSGDAIEVTAYGDDGRRYNRLYVPDEAADCVRLFRESPDVAVLPPKVRSELDGHVAAALSEFGVQQAVRGR